MSIPNEAQVHANLIADNHALLLREVRAQCMDVAGLALLPPSITEPNRRLAEAIGAALDTMQATGRAR